MSSLYPIIFTFSPTRTLGNSRWSRSRRLCRLLCIRRRCGRLALSRGSLFRTKYLVQPSGLVGAPTGLLFLQIGQTARFLVDVGDLVLRLGVEIDNALASGRVRCLLEIGAKSRQKGRRAVGKTIGAIGGAGAVCGVRLLVEGVKGAEEALRDIVLLVERDGALQTCVSDEVSMGEILGENARAWLLLLCDLVIVTVSVGSGRGALAVVVVCVRRRHRDIGRPELGVVKQKGSLGGGFLLKYYSGRLVVAFRSDRDGRDFAAELC